jgi:hypothetical protein
VPTDFLMATVKRYHQTKSETDPENRVTECENRETEANKGTPSQGMGPNKLREQRNMKQEMMQQERCTETN